MFFIFDIKGLILCAYLYEFLVFGFSLGIKELKILGSGFLS